MSVLVWGLAFFLLGVVVYLAGPLLVGPMLPYEYRRPLADWYWKQAVVVADRPQIVERKHGGHTLIATDFKPEWGDEASLGERKSHWSDEVGLMGRFMTRPMGCISEHFNVIGDPKHAEIGKEYIRMCERGDDTVTLENGAKAFNCHVKLDEKPKLVSLHDIRGILGESAEPDIGDVAYDYTKKSQEGFKSANVVEVASFVMAFLAVFGVFWFISSQGGGGGSTMRSVSLMAGVML